MSELSKVLSEDELRRVFAGCLSSLGRSGLTRLARKLGPETGGGLRRALDAGKTKRRPAPGAAKLRQEWRGARRDWRIVIDEACDEKGEYVIQERDWEQPYFDPDSLASDLEKVAARMSRLIPGVVNRGLDRGFSFAQELEENIDEIEGGLPEWMAPFEADGLGLGPKATGCLIEWERLCVLRDGGTMFDLVDRLRGLEDAAMGLCLDEDSLIRLVRSLGPKGGKEVLEGIKRHQGEVRWSPVLASKDSVWFRIYKDLRRKHEH